MKLGHLIITAALWTAAAPCVFAGVIATGGNTTNVIDGYRIHTFTNSATASNFVVTAGGNVEVLVVAGGGGGGETIGGGGGGGGVIYSNTYAVIDSSYTVIVGQGGAGGWGTGYPPGAKGGNSEFGVLTAIGGGAGGGFNLAASGTGGSAGGNGGGGGARAGYTPDQGNDGGTHWGSNAGGGGGGAGQTGADGTADRGGTGGDGRTFEISGVATYYGGGGGGGTRDTTGPVPGTGGADGGGGGGRAAAGAPGLDRTGGGGGGGGFVAELAGGSGGSGIVIVRYLFGIDNAGGATNVTATSAWLNGTLYVDMPDTAVFVYWGPSDGGQDASAWANTNTWAAPQSAGSFTFQATNLSSDATWYYRYAVSNETGWTWALDTSVFITGEVWIEKISDASEIGPTPGTFTVHRVSMATNTALIVAYTVGGTADNGTDYTALSGTATILEGETNATIEVMPIFDHFVEGDETVEVTLVPGPYVLSSLSNATVMIVDYGLATRTWGGGGANAFASNPTNWVEEEAPIAGDAIMLNETSSKSMTWDLDIPIQSWTQDGYTGTVEVATFYPGQGVFTNFTILGDCVISNGVLTQTGNPNVNYEVNRLCVMIEGNLTIGTNGTIDVTGKGFWGNRGPGTGSGNRGGSYGGRGQGGSGPCYGSVIRPINLGSGGLHGPAGGAILIQVAGTLSHDGSIVANGIPGTGVYRAPSGGSVYLVAGAMVGAGSITANGANANQSGGGGGRIALVVTNENADFSGFTGPLEAYSGSGYASGAGTIYLQRAADPDGGGMILVDNLNANIGNTEINPPPTMEAFVAADIRIRGKARLVIAPNYYLEVSGIWSNGANFTAGADSQVIFTDHFTNTSRIFGATTFLNLVCTNDFPSGKTLEFQAGSATTLDALGDLNLRGSESATNVFLRSSTPGQAWKLKVDGTAAQNITCVDVQDSDASSGVEVTAFFSKDSGANTNWTFSSNLAGGTNVWTGAEDAFWSKGGNWSFGRIPLPEDSVRIPATAHDPVMDGTARTVAGLTLEAEAALSLNGFDLTVTNNAVLAGALTGAGGETVTFQNETRLTGALTGGGSGLFIFQGDAYLSGTVTAAGVETFVFKANATFTGSTMTPASSTVMLAGVVPQTIDPAGLTFYKIAVTTTLPVVFSSGFAAHELLVETADTETRSLAFASGETVLVDALTLLSAPGTTNIVLRSSQNGQDWLLNVSGFHSVRGVDVKDSDASAGQAIAAPGCRDSGANTNWDFAPIWAAWWTGQAGDGRFENVTNWWPAAVPSADSRVRVDTAVPMTLASTVTLASLSVGGATPAASVTVNGTLTVGDEVTVGQNGTLLWNRPGVVSNDLTVLAGGLLSHAGNSGSEANKVDLTVEGDVRIDADGAVDVSAKGFPAYQGPGSGVSGNRGGSYGGRGYSGGPCYGSIVAPTNLGSGGTSGPAGGAVIMRVVSGTIHNDGSIFANAQTGTGNFRGPSGGSIFLTAGYLTGTGAIHACGTAGNQSPGGGGRISLVLKRATDFSGFSGSIEAISGRGSQSGGAGTVYLEHAANRPGRGVVLVDNANKSVPGSTDVPPEQPNVPGEADRIAFRVSSAAIFSITNDFTVGDIWLDTANAVLDLGFNTLTVNAREHELEPGKVVNEGAIVWMGLPPGVLIIVR